MRQIVLVNGTEWVVSIDDDDTTSTVIDRDGTEVTFCGVRDPATVAEKIHEYVTGL